MVKYKDGRQTNGRGRVLNSLGISANRSMDLIGVDVIDKPANMTLEAFLNQLQNNPDVEFAEANGIYRSFATPNDPDFASQFYLGSNYINVEPAWDITFGLSSVVVAVVDTGITLTHPDLDGNLWVNPNPSGNSGVNGTRVEIVWPGKSDCTEADSSFGPGQCASNDPTDDTSNTHGTRVSGIIAAETDNAVDMAGIARNVRLMGVKVLNSSGNGTFSSIADGITFAINNGADVINLSLGGPASTTVSTVVNTAIEAGIVVVAAAGNDGPGCNVSHPAAIEKVIAVGSTNSSNGLAFFSCNGSDLDLVAPGRSILSTVASGTDGTPLVSDGTSFSAPMVSAVAALIRSLDSTLTVDQVTNYINFNTTDLGPAGFDTTFGFGLLNAGNAVAAANNSEPFISNPASPNETFPYPNPFNPTTGSVTISVPANLGSTGLKIEIHNLAGQRIKTLTDTNTWDGRNENGNFVASGLYIYRVQTSKGDETGKLTILK